MSNAPEPNFTSWKLDLLETVNADPRCDGTQLKVIEAFLHFANQTTKRAYLSIPDLRVRTSLSQPSITKARKALAALGYLSEAGRTKSGVPCFIIANPHRNRVLDHMAMAKDTLQEQDAREKATERERAANKRRGVKERLGQQDPWGKTDFGDRVKETLPKHLYRTPEGGSLETASPEQSKNDADPWGVMGPEFQPMAPKRKGAA